MAKKHLTKRRQADAASLTLQQWLAQHLFQFAQGAADGGLGQGQTLPRATDRFLSRDFDEDFQMAQLQPVRDFQGHNAYPFRDDLAGRMLL